MQEEITRTLITPEDLKDMKTHEIFERHHKNPEKLEVKGLHSKLTQELKDIHSDIDIQIYISMSERIEKAYEQIKTYTLLNDSPFKVLDDPDTMLLRNGLITIGAKANTGKTSLATHLALEIMKANPKTCFIFFSLDDSEVLSMKRMSSQITKKGYMQINPSLMNSTVDQDLIKPFVKHIFILDELNLEGIRPALNTIKKLGDYENVIACIDYLQLLGSKTITGDKRNILNDILKEVKQIQKDTNSFFMILSQLKRDGNGKDFEYRETSEIENVSDVCIDIKYDTPDKPTDKRIIQITKNKIGIKGQEYTTTINGCFLFSKLTPQKPLIVSQVTIQESKAMNKNYIPPVDRDWTKIKSSESKKP